MTLAEYVAKLQIEARQRDPLDPGPTDADIARILGITRSHVNAIRKGIRRPSYSLMLRIREWSGGAVDLESWELAGAVA